MSVADKLRDEILRGMLLPGEHLGQAELATRFSMSKVPVREALMQLCAEGLLSHDRNRGYFVSKLSFEEGHQLYKLRRWLERELLNSLEWPDPAAMEHIESLLQARLEASDEGGVRNQWYAALAELRYAIFSQSPLKTFLTEAGRLWALTDRYRAMFSPRRSPSGEVEMVSALRDRNREALMSAFEAERDQVEAMLSEAFGR